MLIQERKPEESGLLILYVDDSGSQNQINEVTRKIKKIIKSKDYKLKNLSKNNNYFGINLQKKKK